MEFLTAKLSEKRELLRTKFEEFTINYISEWLDKVEATERLYDVILKFKSTLKSDKKDRVEIANTVYGRLVYTFHCYDYLDCLNDLAKILSDTLKVYCENATVIYSGNSLKILFSVSKAEEWIYDYIEEIVEYIIKEFENYVLDITVPF
ncbi:MAG: hypothetical protein ACP5JX_04185 [Sulfurihydrogenibium sp.]